MSRSLFHKTNDNAYKLTKKTAKRISGGRIRERAGFRILRKRFATARGASELFGNASRHREMVPAHRGRAFLLNSLCPSGISPFKRGRKIEKQTIPAPPSEGGAPRRGEGVQNSDAAPLPMESFRKRGPKISRDTYICE